MAPRPLSPAAHARGNVGWATCSGDGHMRCPASQVSSSVAGIACAINQPWIASQPIAARHTRCASVSTPSAMVLSPHAPARRGRSRRGRWLRACSSTIAQQRGAQGHPLLHLELEAYEGLTPLLGRVHRHVRPAQEHLEVLTMVGQRRHPCARLDLQPYPRNLEGVAQAGQRAARNQQGVAGILEGEQEDELVPTEAGHGVGAATGPSQSASVTRRATCSVSALRFARPVRSSSRPRRSRSTARDAVASSRGRNPQWTVATTATRGASASTAPVAPMHHARSSVIAPHTGRRCRSPSIAPTTVRFVAWYATAASGIANRSTGRRTAICAADASHPGSSPGTLDARRTHPPGCTVSAGSAGRVTPVGWRGYGGRG